MVRSVELKGIVMSAGLRTGLIIVFLGAIGFFLGSNQTAAEESAVVVFEKRFSLCHPLSGPLGTNKSIDEWRQTVMRMKTYAGKRINDEEAEIIIDYLTEIRGK